MRAWWTDVWRAIRSVHPVVILAIAWLLAVFYAHPGYMNWDSADQMHMAHAYNWDDWHPPMMAAYWYVIDRVITGPFPLLVLQLSLFLWGLYAVLRLRFSPRAAALGASMLLLFPPILTPIAVVWKDSQMAAWMIAGAMLALRSSRGSRTLGIAMLFIAAGVRDNALAALPPLCLWIAASWGFRRKLAVCGVAFAIFVGVAGGAALANRGLAMRHGYAWYNANAIHDIAGTICFAEPMSDAEVRAELEGIPLLVDSDLQHKFCEQYTPRWWFPLVFNDHAIFKTSPVEADRDARKRAYFRVVSAHPGAWLHHRWNVTRELLGITNEPPEEPVCQSIAANEAQLRRDSHDARLSIFQKWAGGKFRRLSETILYRPWAYLLVGLVLFGYAVWRRNWLVVVIIASGVLYEASFFLGAAGPAYRYSHWMVTCTCLAAAIIFGERFRAGRVTGSTRR